MTERPLTLFRGGLWNKFCVWICLENDEAPRLALRTFLVLGITWVPLAVLCLWNGTAWGTKVTAPFFLDPGDLFRLLVTPPLLLLAERIMDREFGSVVNYFQSSGIVREEDQATYGRTVDRCQHWMTNMWVEIALLVLLFLTLFFFLDIGEGFPSTVSNWKRDVATGDPSAASYYYRYVTSVVYRFLVCSLGLAVFCLVRFPLENVEVSFEPSPHAPGFGRWAGNFRGKPGVFRFVGCGPLGQCGGNHCARGSL
jgi:hypothetical protein